MVCFQLYIITRKSGKVSSCSLYAAHGEELLRSRWCPSKRNAQETGWGLQKSEHFLLEKIKWCQDYVKVAYFIIKLLRSQDEIRLTNRPQLCITWWGWKESSSPFLNSSLLADQADISVPSPGLTLKLHNVIFELHWADLSLGKFMRCPPFLILNLRETKRANYSVVWIKRVSLSGSICPLDKLNREANWPISRSILHVLLFYYWG